MNTEQWDKSIEEFLTLCNKHQVKMIMVGGGAVNFHGYQRHSADVDFWIDSTKENFNKLIQVFRAMGYDINDFPNEVRRQEQNISIKFSPVGLDVELITNFSINKTFDEALNDSEQVTFKSDKTTYRWNVLSLEDLIASKIKAGRNKDLLDVQELKRINK